MSSVWKILPHIRKIRSCHHQRLHRLIQRLRLYQTKKTIVIFLHLQKLRSKFKILAKKSLVRKYKGLREKTIKERIFFVFVVLFLVSPAVSWMDERPESENNGKEKKNQLLTLPILYYTPETKIAGGVGGIFYLRSMKEKLSGHPSIFFMDMVYTQEKQFIVEIIPDLYLNTGKFHLVGYLGFKNYIEKFYGIGSHTTDTMEEDFSYRNFQLKCSLRKRVGAIFYVGVQYDFEHSKITETEPGGILDSGDIPGKDGGTLSGLGILLVQDNRDNIFYPTKGTLLQTDAMMFSPAIASDYNFHRFSLDFRQYVSVFSKHVLAFQQGVQVTSGDIPFQRLPVLGGPNVMRGYIQGRFRAKKAIFLQMEYRMPLIWRLSAAGFVGFGDVADKMKKFKLHDLKFSGGLGIRYQINRKSGTNVRLDFGFAKGNFGVYAMINEAF
jgi:hypothetical protein